MRYKRQETDLVRQVQDGKKSCTSRGVGGSLASQEEWEGSFHLGEWLVEASVIKSDFAK